MLSDGQCVIGSEAMGMAVYFCQDEMVKGLFVSNCILSLGTYSPYTIYKSTTPGILITDFDACISQMTSRDLKYHSVTLESLAT